MDAMRLAPEAFGFVGAVVNEQRTSISLGAGLTSADIPEQLRGSISQNATLGLLLRRVFLDQEDDDTSEPSGVEERVQAFTSRLFALSQPSLPRAVCMDRRRFELRHATAAAVCSKGFRSSRSFA